jgi:hypothetical protein
VTALSLRDGLNQHQPLFGHGLPHVAFGLLAIRLAELAEGLWAGPRM